MGGWICNCVCNSGCVTNNDCDGTAVCKIVCCDCCDGFFDEDVALSDVSLPIIEVRRNTGPKLQTFKISV